jgi:hypothetical protein
MLVMLSLLPNKTVVWEKPAQKDKREKLITNSGNVDHVEEETKKKKFAWQTSLFTGGPLPCLGASTVMAPGSIRNCLGWDERKKHQPLGQVDAHRVSEVGNKMPGELISANNLHEEVIPPGTHFLLLTKFKQKNIPEKRKKLIIVGIYNQFPSRPLPNQLTRSFVIAS